MSKMNCFESKIFMRRTIISLFIWLCFLCASSLIVHADYVIPYDSFEFEGHTYKAYVSDYRNNISSFEEAEAFCEEKGGHLATITSERENSAVTKYLTGLAEKDPEHYYYEKILIGLNKVFCKGNDEEKQWVTGESVQYTNYASYNKLPYEKDSDSGYYTYLYLYDKPDDYAIYHEIHTDDISIQKDNYNGFSRYQTWEKLGGFSYKPGKWVLYWSDFCRYILCEWDRVERYDINKAYIHAKTYYHSSGDYAYAYSDYDYNYAFLDGEPFELDQISTGGSALKEGTDYEITIVNKDGLGEGSATITGKGRVINTRKITFIRIPKAIDNVSVNGITDGKKRTIVVSFDSYPGVDGYLIVVRDPDYNYKQYYVEGEKSGRITWELPDVSPTHNRPYEVSVRGYMECGGKRRYCGTGIKGYPCTVPKTLLVSDFWGFKNFTVDHCAPYFLKFMGSAQAQALDDYCKGGVCYGMLTSSLASVTQDYPKVYTWGNASVLSDVTSMWTMSSGNLLTAHDVAIYGHCIEALPYRKLQTYDNYGDLKGLYDLVKKASKEGWAVPVRLIGKSLFNKSGHSIAAIEIVEENDEKVKIRCYDSNYPKDTERYLILNKFHNTSTFISWSYMSFDGIWKGNNKETLDGAGHGILPTDRITYDNYNPGGFFKQEFENVKSTTYEQYMLVKLQVPSALQESVKAGLSGMMNDAQLSTKYIFFPTNGDNKNSEILIWKQTPNSYYKTLKFSSVPSGIKVTVACGDYLTSVDVPCDTALTIDMRSDKSKVEAKPVSGSGTYGITTSYFKSGKVDTEKISVKAKKSNTTSVEVNKGKVDISGATSITVTKKEGTDSKGKISYSRTVTKKIPSAEPDKTYEIKKDSKNKLSVTTGTKTGTGNDSSATLKKGTTKTIGKLKYKVTSVSGNGGTATVIGVTSRNCSNLTVPATVKISGKKLKVTEIKGGALKGLKNLKKVTIGKNVKKIGAKAFSGDKKLVSIVIKSSVLKIIGKKAFSNINKNAVYRVPKKKKKAYKKLLSSKTGFKKSMKIK